MEVLFPKWHSGDFYPPFFFFLFFFFPKCKSLSLLMMGQLQILVAANLLEWKDLITEPQEQALAESQGDMKGYSGS